MNKFSNIFTIEEEIEESYMFCYDGIVDMDSLSSELEDKFNLKLKANKKGLVVNGSLISLRTPIGEHSTWCGPKRMLSTDHTCVILFLYKQDKTADGVKIRRKSLKKGFSEELRTFFENKNFSSKE
jgi:hypothetical protein